MTAVKIAHLITGLSTGGAEQMLYKLLSRNDGSRFQPCVISLMDQGTLGKPITDLGIPVFFLGMRRGVPDVTGIWKLWNILRRERPRLLQTWLYHADVLGLLGGKLVGVPHVIWNLRCSNMNLAEYSKVTGLTMRAGARLSHWPEAIIVNSRAGQRFHEELGYRPKHWEFIPNGFDLDHFKPNQSARVQLRERLKRPEDAFLIGHVARFDPMKGHEIFLRAAHMIAKRRAGPQFVLAGRDVEITNTTLRGLIDDLELNDRVHLLGECHEVAHITAALDVASSSSVFGEAFSNAIGEAMACGVPCVVTDVGDSAIIVGDTGNVVPPGDPEALAEAWDDLLCISPEERQRIGSAARRRVQTCYSLSDVTDRYQRFYQDIAQQ